MTDKWLDLAKTKTIDIDIDMTHGHEKDIRLWKVFQLSLNDDDDGYAHECP